MDRAALFVFGSPCQSFSSAGNWPALPGRKHPGAGSRHDNSRQPIEPRQRQRYRGQKTVRLDSAPGRLLVVLSVADVCAPGGALALLPGFRQRQMREETIG